MLLTCQRQARQEVSNSSSRSAASWLASARVCKPFGVQVVDSANVNVYVCFGFRTRGREEPSALPPYLQAGEVGPQHVAQVQLLQRHGRVGRQRPTTAT